MAGLGRGLGSLIQNSPQPGKVVPVTPVVGQLTIAVDLIDPNPYQPREHFDRGALEELAASIKQYGVLEPLILTATSGGRYELIAGERRLRASKLAGLTVVPVVVKTVTDQEKLELAIVENLLRENLNAMEEAEGYRELMSTFSLTQEECAQKIGKSREVVANAVRLLNLAPAMQQAIRDGRISAGHARALLAVPDLAARERLFQDMLANKMNVRAAEAKAREKSGKSVAGSKDPSLLAHERALRERFGTKIAINKKTGGAGKIEIEFWSDEEYSRVIDLLSGT